SEGLKAEKRKKVAVDTVFCAGPDVVEKFKKDESYKALKAAGIRLTSICPLMYTNNPLSHRKAIATNSNKLRTYSLARYYKDAKMLNIITGKEEK
ncbi:MAG TPA: aconitase X, partial [Eubacteriales bacterium]|nr:aconitase X [Eubacteriales bacterium]